MVNVREQRVKLMVDVLTKIVQRAHPPTGLCDTYPNTHAVPNALLAEAASILGINREF